MAEERYILSVWEHRPGWPADWFELAVKVQGVTVVHHDPGASAALITATDEALIELRKVLGPNVTIGPDLQYKAAGESANQPIKFTFEQSLSTASEIAARRLLDYYTMPNAFALPNDGESVQTKARLDLSNPQLSIAREGDRYTFRRTFQDDRGDVEEISIIEPTSAGSEFKREWSYWPSRTLPGNATEMLKTIETRLFYRAAERLDGLQRGSLAPSTSTEGLNN